MPTISSVFNGGTITRALIIDPGANSSVGLVLRHAGIDYFSTGTDGGVSVQGGIGGAVLLLSPTGGAQLFGTNACGVDVRSDSIQLDLPTGGHLYVYDHNFAPLFRVDEATGALHGKTGQSLTFDL